MEAECAEGTVLVGCGFGSPGRCDICFEDAANPCGNCQSSRLHVAFPGGEACGMMSASRLPRPPAAGVIMVKS